MAERERVAFAFPGQGSQKKEMGRDLFTDPRGAVQDVLGEASQILEDRFGWTRGLKEVCMEGAFDDTALVQPAIVAVSLAAHTALGLDRKRPEGVVGHSLGEVSAGAASGAYSISKAVLFAAHRGREMSEAASKRPGSMAAIFNLSYEHIEGIREDVFRLLPDCVLAVANINSPTQIIVSGDNEAVTKAVIYAVQQGAGSQILPVSIAAHSEMMQPAQESLRRVLSLLDVRAPILSWYSPTTKRVLTSPDEIRDTLVGQLTSRVEWVETTQRMIADGYRSWIEVGPGRVLTGLMRQIDPTVSMEATRS